MRQTRQKLTLPKDSFFGIVTSCKHESYSPKKETAAMKTGTIVEQPSQKVNLILDCQTEIVGKHLSADEAEKKLQLIKQATQEAEREAFRM